MIKIDKISIKKIFEDTELGNSRLEFNIKGININYILINTIRRTIFSDIPIYAFDNFKFEKNTSNFHNNYLKLRISALPVWGIENKINYIDSTIIDNTLSKVYEENKNEIDDINYLNQNDNENENDIDTENDDINKFDSIEASTLKQMTMYVNYKNKTNNIINITTNDAKFYYEEKLIKLPYNNVLLLKLHPLQEISFVAITNLSTEKTNAIYSPVTITTYKEINDNEYIFILESRGQITEKNFINSTFKY